MSSPKTSAKKTINSSEELLKKATKDLFEDTYTTVVRDQSIPDPPFVNHDFSL
jgi:hypothetical protein